MAPDTKAEPAAEPASVVFTERDYASDQEVRWCPACGDYALLKTLRECFAERQEDPKQLVCVSGIGCAGRLPHYLACHGLHGLHGRAAAIATGVKLANPDLSVWVVTGDGDGLSIGAGHLAHLLRRNLDVQVILVNNQVYGLTKGQVSPTSPKGMQGPGAKSGNQDAPLSAADFAMGSGAQFFARALDKDRAGLRECLLQAAAFPGTALVEVLQNCVIYHDGAFANVPQRPLVPGEKIGEKIGPNTGQTTGPNTNDTQSGNETDSYWMIDSVRGALVPPSALTNPPVMAQPFVHDPSDPAKARLLAGVRETLFTGVLWALPAS